MSYARLIDQKRFRIGVLVPFTNTNLESDLHRLQPANTAIHFTRIAGYESDELPDSVQMHRMAESDISCALQLIAGVNPDVILYGCTSATITHGAAFDRRLTEGIQSTTGVKAISAAGALIVALQAIGAKKIGFASPYISSVNSCAIRFFSNAGFETVICSDPGRALSSHEQGALTPEEVFELAVRADHENADAVVMSCTDLRAVEIIAAVEAEINKPVITSNQAMVFAILQSCSLKHNGSNYGRLFDCLSVD